MKSWMRLCGVVLAAGMTVLPVMAQEAAKKEPPKPPLSPSAEVLEQWNEIGRKLIAIAEDLPEDKYDYKPNPDSACSHTCPPANPRPSRSVSSRFRSIAPA